MNQKNLIAILIVIVAVLGLVLAYVMGTKNAQVPVQTGAAKKYPEEPVKSDQSAQGTFTYKNDTTGFTAEIPNVWKEKYKVVESPNSSMGGFASEGGYISFQLLTTDSNWIKTNSNYVEFLSIVAYPVSKLANFQKECASTNNESLTCVVIKNQIAKNEAYAFSYIKSNNLADYPKDFTQEDLSRADSVYRSFRAGEVEKVAAGNWELISGDPLDNCSTPIYKGEAVIHGWYEWDYIYVEKGWVLKISAEDQNKLPVYYYDEQGKAHYPDGAILKDGTPELIAKLKKASKASSVELTVRGFSTYCEGLPTVSLAAPQ